MAITTLVICCPGGYNTGMFELFRPTVCRALLLVLASAVPLYGQPAEPEQEDGFVGVLLSQQAIDLASRFEGRLREVNVRIGDPVIELIIEGTITQISTEIDIPSGLIFCEAIVSPPENWNGPPLPGRAVRVSLSQE